MHPNTLTHASKPAHQQPGQNQLLKKQPPDYLSQEISAQLHNATKQKLITYTQPLEHLSQEI